MNALLISNNINHCKELKQNFEKNYAGLKVRIVQTEKAASDFFIDNPDIAFFIVDASFSDNMNNFLSNLIDLSGRRPIIVCGSEEDVDKISKGHLLKKEATHTLHNFNDHEKITLFIQQAVSWFKKNYRDFSPISEESDEYLPFKLRNLYFYDSFPNDLYVKISDNKYMVTFEKNTPIKEYQVQKISKRKIKLLYINKSLHIAFLEESMKQNLEYFKKYKQLDRKTLLAHMRSTALVQDYLINLGMTDFVSKFIDEFLAHIIEVLSKHHSITSLYQVYDFPFRSNVSRSLLCAYFSYYLVNGMGWRSKTVNKKFLFASIVQDAHIQDDELTRIRTKEELDNSDYSAADKELYLKHPKLIAEIARLFSQFPDVDFLLEHHHILPTRDGFPTAPSPSEIQVAVCVFIIATNFARDVDGIHLKPANLKKIFTMNYKKKFNVGNFKDAITQLEKLAVFN